MQPLSSEDILFFKENGYLIKKSVLNPELMEKARNRMWNNLPPPLERDKPETWIGPFAEPGGDSDSHRHNFMWKYRAPGREDWMIRMLATAPEVWAMVEQFLGVGMVETPDRIRGIYSVLTEGEAPERPLKCHVDAHPFNLGIVGYIDDVGPGGGGFTVWPGSHKTFYYDYNSQYANEKKASYDTHREEFDREGRYVDCYGNAGDIVFWHHRIGHSVGHNRSNRIRQAVLYDFKRKNLNVDEPPCENMWRDWPGITGIER